MDRRPSTVDLSVDRRLWTVDLSLDRGLPSLSSPPLYKRLSMDRRLWTVDHTGLLTITDFP